MARESAGVPVLRDQERGDEMKEWIEGWLLCLGVGFFYLGASATEQGQTAAGLIMFGAGFCVLCLMLFFVVERK